eukprot:gene5451-7545_t
MLYLLFIFCFIVINVSSLDVSFIPNDENAPLPLSTKYRDSLRKLCDLLKTKADLPAEVMEKRGVLNKMCKKLAKDDNNINGSFSVPWNSSTIKQLIYTIIGVGSGYLCYTHRIWIISTFKLFMKKIIGKENEKISVNKSSIKSTPVTDMVNELDKDLQRNRIAEAREARLKRFAEMNSYNEVSDISTATITE